MTQVQTFPTTRPGSIPYYLPLLKKLDWKVGLCFVLAIAGVYLGIKALRQVFYMAPAQKELEKGLEVSPATIQKIGQLIPKILNHDMDGEIEWVRQGDGLIFKIPSAPGLIFKMQRLLTGQSFTFWENGHPRLQSVSGNVLTKAHFDNIIEGQKVCSENHLDLIVIPHAKLVEVKHESKTYTLLAQQYIPHERGESAQEEIWEKQSAKMAKVVEQLAIFTALMNLSAVTRSDMPLIEMNGDCRIAILDLKYREHARIGLFGELFSNRIGLIRCLFSETLMNTVIEVARQCNVLPTESQGTIEQIKEEVQVDIDRFYQVREFHRNKRGLTLENAGAPIVVGDVKALDFSDEMDEIEIRNSFGEWERKQVTLEDTLNELLLAINDAIKTNLEQTSIRGKRWITLNLVDDYPTLGRYRNCGAPLEKSHMEALTPTEEKRLWLHRALQALKDHGYIFDFTTQPNGCNFYIQA
jgi:hypothetical protein